MHGHPQACGFASSCALILPHHVMFHSQQKIISISMILLEPAKGLALQTSNNYSFTQDASLNNYWETTLLYNKQTLKNTVFIG
jgi:hypothetical protein